MPLDISTVTPTHMIEGSHVDFMPDLSTAGFQTPQTLTDTDYNPALNRITFLWDFGTGGFANSKLNRPINVLSSWKRRSLSAGPCVTEVFENVGDHTVRLLGLEYYNGEFYWEEAFTTISIAPRLSIFQDTDFQITIVQPVGYDDFSATETALFAEAGGTIPYRQRNTDIVDQSFLYNNRLGNSALPQLWLFMRGAEFQFKAWVDGFVGPHSFFDAIGPEQEIENGDRVLARIDPTATNQTGNYGAALYLTNNYGGNAVDTPSDFRLRDFFFFGNFDCTTQRGLGAGETNHADTSVMGLDFRRNVFGTLMNVHVQGVQRSCIAMQSASVDRLNSICLYQVSYTNFGSEYPTFAGDWAHPDSCLSIVGANMVQQSDATDGRIVTSGSTPGGSRSIVRANRVSKTYLGKSSFFTTDDSNHCVKIINSPESGGYIANVYQCTFEGGVVPLSIGSNIVSSSGGGTSVEVNVVIDSSILIGTHGSSNLLYSCCPGVTFRNSLMIMPNVNRVRSIDMKSLIYFETIDGENDDQPPTAAVLAVPIEIHNVTAVFNRTESQNRTETPVFYGLTSGTSTNDFTGAVLENNVWHAPRLDTPQIPDGPLSSTVLFTVNATAGRRDPDTFVLDATVASPSDAAQAYLPIDDSDALDDGDSLGLLGYLDAIPKLRGETTSRGYMN